MNRIFFDSSYINVLRFELKYMLDVRFVFFFSGKFGKFLYGLVYIYYDLCLFRPHDNKHRSRDSPIVQDVLLQQMVETLVSSKKTPYSYIFRDFLEIGRKRRYHPTPFTSEIFWVYIQNSLIYDNEKKLYSSSMAHIQFSITKFDWKNIEFIHENFVKYCRFWFWIPFYI